MEMIIKAMQQEDWKAVADIFQEGIDLKTATFYTNVPSYEEWDECHTKDCRLIAVEDGKNIGWAALRPYSNRLAYRGVAEVSIYIKAGYRGKHVGSRLLQALIDESEKQGYWTLQSRIFKINNASIALHEKLGFRMVGYLERVGKDSNGLWQDVVLMERRSKITGM